MLPKQIMHYCPIHYLPEFVGLRIIIKRQYIPHYGFINVFCDHRRVHPDRCGGGDDVCRLPWLLWCHPGISVSPRYGKSIRVGAGSL